MTQERVLTYRTVSELRPDPLNPRKHNSAQLRALARCIRRFGFNAPILVDKHNKIIAGHGRLEGAKLAGLVHVPVIALDDLTETQAKAYMLADNKLSDRSSWDEALLAINLKELSEIVCGFDIEDTGFEIPEVDLLIQSMEDEDETDQADDISVQVGPSVSVAGDVWTLGEHRVICGDALDAASYITLLHEEKAAAVFTDAPYNVRINGNVSGLGKVQHREFAMASGEMTHDAFASFLTRAFGHCKAWTTPGSLIYAAMDWRHLAEMEFARQANDLDLINVCVWVKSNGGMGAFYRSRHELIFVFRNGPTPHRNNVQLGKFGRNRTNVWHYAGANSFPRRGGQDDWDLHPTVKPVRLVSDALLDSTKRGDVILDPFLGSGTTVLAAERTGRIAHAIELDPIYVDTSILRWQKLTGKKACDATGATFEQRKHQLPHNE